MPQGTHEVRGQLAVGWLLYHTAPRAGTWIVRLCGGHLHPLIYLSDPGRSHLYDFLFMLFACSSKLISFIIDQFTINVNQLIRN